MKKNRKKQIIAMAMATTMAFTLAPVPQQPWCIQAKAEQAINNMINAKGAYKFDPTSTWDNNKGKENNVEITTDSVPQDGTMLVMDVLLPEKEGNAPAFNGSMKAVGILRLGSDWNWVQSNVTPELKSADFKDKVEIDGTTYYKASVKIPFADTVGANDADGNWNSNMPFAQAVTEPVNAVTVQFAGYQCDYEGDIAVANAELTHTEGEAKQTALKTWDFTEDADSWEYAEGWEYKYTGGASKVEAVDGRLQIGVDYSKDSAESWSQLCVRRWGNVDIDSANEMTMDFYYKEKNMTKGGFAIKATLQGDEGEATLAEVNVSLDLTQAEDAGNGWKKVKVSLPFDSAISGTCCNIAIGIVGKNTDYAGDVALDDIILLKKESTDTSVDSTKIADVNKKAVVITDSQLVTNTSEKEEKIAITKEVSLVDPNSSINTKAVYSYLKAMGESKSVIYGHQNDTWRKAGSKDLSNSDTKDVTGSISGIVGIDGLSLTGNEYSASEYNAAFKPETALPETPAGNVQAAALLTNQNIKEGAIITMSLHMPNFSVVKENENYTEGDPTYARYDFSGYSPNNLKGNVMNQILPGGQYNDKFNAYLDMVADYAKQVDGTILFRPFHENTGSWFWWGAAFCDAATYKNVWKYTVEYLRDEKDVHNLLYVYGPGSEAANVEEYGERYPGDAYVDMVGLDIYNDAPTEDNNNTWFKTFRNSVGIVQEFAKDHEKLMAVTETGIRNETQKSENQTALLSTGNQDKDWYRNVLNAISETDASYFLLWANFGKKDGYYTPYVDKVNKDGSLHGHEMLDAFLAFYNDPRTVFASQQKTVLQDIDNTLKEVQNKDAEAKIEGYIVSPVARDRILDGITVKAKVNQAGEEDKITVTLKAKQEKTVDAVKTGKYYVAELSREDIVSLGEDNGTITLAANGTVLDQIGVIFNKEKPKEDPYEIDGFENYSGVDSLLTAAWTTNKASGCTIKLGLDKEKALDGDYAMKFDYVEGKGGWAGATIAKEVDWSECNALQFYTIPDGNNQKVVVQITANGMVYEAYMNTYKEYCNTKEPLKVTIPFEEFCARDTTGNPKGGLVSDKGKIESVGLWVNAVDDSEAMTEEGVSGTIYYDKITAVKDTVEGVVIKSAKEVVKPNEKTDSDTTEQPKPTEQPGSTEVPKSTEPVTTVSGTTQAVNKQENPLVKDNDEVTDGNNRYQVLSVEGKTVAFCAPTRKNVTSIVIPDTVTINGQIYQVVSIAKNACKNCKKLNKIVIGKNITVIGKNAFKNCKNVKKVIVKTKKLKSVGRNAFKGLNKKARIKVPASKYKKYQKLFQKKGQPKGVRIIK